MWARQKKLEKIDKVEFEKIRQGYEVRKEIYERGKADGSRVAIGQTRAGRI